MTITQIMLPESEPLISQFFSAIELRQLDRCVALLSELILRSQQQPLLHNWCNYLQGIMTFELQNDWAKAERIFSELLTMSAELNLRSRLYYALARTLEVQGRWQEAIEANEQILLLADKLDRPLDKAKAWKQIAVCYRQGYVHGDYDRSVLERSVQVSLQALSLFDSITEKAGSQRWFEGSLWNTLGITYLNLENWDRAADCYHRDLAICLELNDQHGAGISYLNLGEVFQRRSPQAWPQALIYYNQALHLMQTHRNHYLEADVLQNLGSLYQQMGNVEEALHHYKQAITLIEDLRTRVTATDVRTNFFTTVIETYQRLVRLLIEINANAEAFDMVERARSRSFIELLGEQTLRSPQKVPNNLLEQEAKLRSELRQLYQLEESQTEAIMGCEAELDRLLREIRLFAAEYTDLRVVQPLTHRQVQQKLPQTSALLSYFVTDSAIFAFVVKPDQLTVDRLPLTVSDLQRAFDKQNNLHRMRPGGDGHLHNPWMLERLYQSLLLPVLERLKNVEQLFILPHSTLHLIPFHALCYFDQAGQKRTLLDDYQIVYAPSATVLLDYCQQVRPQALGSLLAIGYNDDLTHAEAETIAIANLVEESVVLTGDNATCDALYTQAEKFRWLHFSCHGRFNPQRPLMSHLCLADVALYASDVLQRLQLQAELVTLAACETGRNQVLKGDELIGLVRAFLYAGTSAIVVSLWPVDELSTRILMERFYHELLQGKSKAAALRVAQQYVRDLSAAQLTTILQDYKIADPEAQVAHLLALTHTPQTKNYDPSTLPVFAHPYFWAPFMLIGDRISY